MLEERVGRAGLGPAAAIAQEKMQTLEEFWPLAGFLLERREFDERAFAKVMRDGAAERLVRTREALVGVEPFAEPEIEVALRALVEELGARPGEVFQPVRLAISGTSISPGIFESVALLGREETLARIDAALART